jgi:hypothetical protein
VLFSYLDDDKDVYGVSELQPPKGLLFIPQVIYEHEEPWWNYINRGKLMIHPAESSCCITGGTSEGNYEFGLAKYLCLYFEGIFNMP